MNHFKLDRRFSTVIAAGTVFVSLSAAAYWNVIDWQAASEGGVSSYSGAFTDVNHWSVGRYPGQYAHLSDGAYFRKHDVGAYTVTFPSGDFTNGAGLRIELNNGDDITFSGLNTHLTVTNAAWGTHGFQFFAGAGYYPYFAICNLGSPVGGEFARFENFLARTCRYDDTIRLEYTGDLVSTNGASLTFFNMENGSVGSADLKRGDIVFGAGSGIVAQGISHGGKTALTNRLEFLSNVIHTKSSISLGSGATTSLANEFLISNSTVRTESAGFSANGVDRTHNRFEIVGSDIYCTGTSGSGTGGIIDFLFCGGSWTNMDTVTFGAQSQGAGWTNNVRIADLPVYFEKSVNFYGAQNSGTDYTVNAVITNCDIVSKVGGYSAITTYGGAQVDIFDTKWVNLFQILLGNASATRVPKLRLHDSRLVAGKTHSFVGSDGSADFELRGTSSFTGSGASTYLGGNASADTAKWAYAATGRLDLCDSAIFTAGSYFCIGSRAGAYGIVNVRDNAQATPLVADEPPRVYIGRYGSGELNVYGGTVYGGQHIRYNESIKLGQFASPNETGISSLNQFGGIVGEDGMTTIGIIASYAEGRKSMVRLDGGLTKVPFVRGGAGSGAYTTPGTGYAGFFANGGHLVAQTATTEFLAYFDEAKLGAKGLMIESDYDITVPQDFADQDGASGKGLLTLVGSGTKTLSGKASSVVNAAEGDIVFAVGATLPKTLVVTNGATVVFEGSATLENLTVGDANSVGVLNLKHGNTLTVTNDLDIGNLQIVLDGTFTAGEDIDLFVCPNGVSAETEAKFIEAFAKAGLAGGTACRMEKVAGAGSSVTLRVKVVTASPLVIRVDEGSETHTTNILYNASEKLQTIVADGASLTLDGKIGYGELEKTGAGVLKLSNAANLFYPGLKLLEGVLAVDTPAALGGESAMNAETARLGGGILRTEGDSPLAFPRNLKVEGETSTTLATVETTVETVMPPMTASQGNLMKKGAEQLVFACTGAQSMPLSSDGTATDKFHGFGLHSGFTAFEGETIFRGTAPGTTLSMPVNFAIGIPEEEELGAQPGLVVDNMTLDLGSKSLYMAPSCTNDQNFAFTSYVTDPYVMITNGGVLKVTHYSPLNDIPGHYMRKFGVCRTTIDGGELRVTGTLYGSAAATGGGYVGWQIAHSTYDVRNGGALRATAFQSSHSIGVTVDHGTFAGYSASGALVPVVIATSTGECTSRWDLVSSEFCVSKIWRPSSLTSQPHNMRFEDTRWSCGDSDLTIGSDNVNLNFSVTGCGLKVAPYAGRTYSVTRPLTGMGGIVMDGPGTLRFCNARYLGADAADPVTVKYTGATELNGGTIDFGGFPITNLTLTGTGGTVTNATFVDAVIRNLDATFASDVTFDGTVTVDLAGAAVETGVITVGHYSGGAPAITYWQLKNAARGGVTGTFFCENGDIKVSVGYVGMIMIFR